MDNQRSLELLSSGVEKWNIWARIRQSERAALYERGLWHDGNNECSEEVKLWHKEADVQVPGDRFGNPVDYSGYIFPGNVLFNKATFAANASFSLAVFEGDVHFAGAKFDSGADFSGATFCGVVNFQRATMSFGTSFSEARFRNGANFAKATFARDTRFENTNFAGGAVFEGVRFNGRTDFGSSRIVGPASFKDSIFSGEARFEGVSFGRAADFERVNILGLANFENSKFEDVAQFYAGIFEGVARFKGAMFLKGDPNGGAWFNSASFRKEARFDKVTFLGKSIFAGVTFSSNAWFSDTKFVGGAEFLQAGFNSFTSFDRAKFEGEAAFRAIDAKSVFSLSGTIFRRVPDFIQSHFVEAPRLDNSRIEHQKSLKLIAQDGKKVSRRDPDLAARWRALKRLAVQGHDHVREQTFFKGELEARRGTEEQFWHGVYIFGVLFGWFSDYGRSIWRPFFWWVGSIFLFAAVHLYGHLAIVTGSPCLSLILRRLVEIASNEQTLSCVTGQDDPVWTAFLLSAQKAVLVFGAIPATKLNQMYSCLYGTHLTDVSQLQALPGGLSPIVPDSITAIGIFQYLVSAALVFLLLLAIRNHFRIK
ncbi:MAG: pentapeptide repeat-containing protein [Nitratireductor sp.]